MSSTRTKNTARNAAWGLVYRITTTLGPFVVRTIIIQKLGMEYAGLSNLFTSLLTVLNLANLGFHSSIVFTMYKAIAEEDNDSLCAMLNYYRKIFTWVGIAILAMGMAVMPFLPHFVQGECPSDVNLYVLFIIYLSESVLDYFLFPHSSALLIAYQRTDITLKVSTVRRLVQYGLECALLIIFSNYYVYVITLPLMFIPNNVATHVMARKMYPEIVCRGELDRETKRVVKEKVITLFGHKVGSTILYGIDSVLVSAFFGLTMSGMYGNYYMILRAVNSLVETVTSGSVSSIGNKLLTSSKESNYRLFRTMTYAWITLISAASVCMLCFYQPFIAGVWVGKEGLLPEGIMILFVLYFYTWMFRIMQMTYRDAAGLWNKDWLKPYVGIVLNLSGSILLIKLTGSVSGVLIPTIFVMFFVYFPWEAKILFDHLFCCDWKPYVLRVLAYTLLAVVSCGTTYILCILISPENTFASLLLRIPVVGIVFSAIWLVFTHKTEEFHGIVGILRRFVKKKG